jgi:Tripartite tricarboxylate transporter TctB family
VNQPAHNDTDQRSGISTHIVEAVVAFFVVVLGVIVITGSSSLGSGWTTDGPGAGYFPFYIGLILCISGAWIMFQALFGKKKNTDVFVDSEQLKRVMQVLIPSIFYVLGVQFLGLYVASAIYITLFMVWLGKYTWIKSAVVALCVMVLFYMMFEVWFKVPLFKGALNPLSLFGLK